VIGIGSSNGIIGHIIMAWRGRKVWLRLKKDYSITENQYLFIMPDDNRVLNTCVLGYIGCFLKKRYFSGAIIIFNNNEHKYNITNSYGKEIILTYLEPSRITALLKYYRLLQFKSEIKVISFYEPFGSDGLLKKENISLEYLVSTYFLDGAIEEGL